MKVKWSNNAVDHLEAIRNHIAQISPEYASRTVARILDKSVQIAAFPLSGKVVPELGIEQIREVFVTPYRVLYYISPNSIEILAVLHMSMDVLE